MRAGDRSVLALKVSGVEDGFQGKMGRNGTFMCRIHLA